MTDTCACPPGACVDDKTRAMAAELLALRARVTELEAAEPIGYTIGYDLGDGPVFDWQFLGSLEQAKDRIANNALRRPWRIFELREVTE